MRFLSFGKKALPVSLVVLPVDMSGMRKILIRGSTSIPHSNVSMNTDDSPQL
jgi:hypothetical protein